MGSLFGKSFRRHFQYPYAERLRNHRRRPCGDYMEKYLSSLRLLTMQYDYLDQDALFIHCGKYRWEASAYGMAFKTDSPVFPTVV